MNTIRLELENVVGRQWIRDGIVFEDIAIVRVFVDEEDLLETPDFDGALVYFDELKRSMSERGNYLIFTCACGIAEDGGWEGVAVEMTETTVGWHLEAATRALDYCFERAAYASAIETMVTRIGTGTLPLEPRAVVFPEWFRQ